MALKLITNYSKRLGLPGFSSHMFSVSVETEITNVNDVSGEVARLYETLQQNVDDQIQQTGFVPGSDYGSGNTQHVAPVNRIAKAFAPVAEEREDWRCSDKQRGLILKLIADHNLEEVAEEMAQEMFGASPKDLNKLQASGLIARILEEHSKRPRPKAAANGNGRYTNGGGR